MDDDDPSTIEDRETRALQEEWLEALDAAPPPSLFPTLEEVRATIPPGGIAIGELVKLFGNRVMDRQDEFVQIVESAGRQDPMSKKILPKRNVEPDDVDLEDESQHWSPRPTQGEVLSNDPQDVPPRMRDRLDRAARGLMPLHIPPHIRDGRSRRLSEPMMKDDFSDFQYQNLPVLEKAGKDVAQKLREDATQARERTATGIEEVTLDQMHTSAQQDGNEPTPQGIPSAVQSHRPGH